LRLVLKSVGQVPWVIAGQKERKFTYCKKTWCFAGGGGRGEEITSMAKQRAPTDSLRWVRMSWQPVGERKVENY